MDLDYSVYACIKEYILKSVRDCCTNSDVTILILEPNAAHFTGILKAGGGGFTEQRT